MLRDCGSRRAALTRHNDLSRSDAIADIQSAVQHRLSPRREMSLAVTFAALAGLATSVIALHLGMTAMAIRYPLAVAMAYLVFLGYLWVWLRRHGLRIRSDARTRQIDISPTDLDVVQLPFSLKTTPCFEFGQGGGFAGGGGGSEWGNAAMVPLPNRTGAPVDAPKGSSFDLDLDDGWWVLLVAGLAAALVLAAAIYTVFIAPALFAELLLDASLAAGLYRRLRGIEARAWWRSAIRRTLPAALISALILATAGAVMQSVYPDAASIGKVWQAATKSRNSTP